VIAHSAAPMLANHYKGTLSESFPGAEVMIAHAAPALGSHAGPGGAAVAVLDSGPIERMIERLASTREN